jgi:flagellin-like protein
MNKLNNDNKKGITPIIAIILLLMMTVAAAGGAFYWLLKVQGEMQGGTEQYQENVFEKLASTLNWEDADYNTTTEMLTIYVQNVGTTEIPVDNTSQDPTTTWILKDNDQKTICSTKWDNDGTSVRCQSGCASNIAQSATRKMELNLTSTACTIAAYSNDTLMRVTIFYSGKASVSGTFES